MGSSVGKKILDDDFEGFSDPLSFKLVSPSFIRPTLLMKIVGNYLPQPNLDGVQ